jgi:hypothetical protein
MSSFMSSLRTHGPWLSSYEYAALDEDEALSPEDSVEDMANEGREDSVYSSSANEPDLSHFASGFKDSPEVMVDEWGAVLVYSSFADDPDLSHFVSVVDLQRTPGASSIDFSMFCLGAPAATRDMQRPVRLVGQLPLSLPSRCLAQPWAVPSVTLVSTWGTLSTWL